MLNNFVKKISVYKSCSCVEIRLQGAQVRYRQIGLKLTKGVMSIINTTKITEDLDAILEKVKPNSPLILLVNGYGILHRSISPLSASDQEIVGQVLPNANVKDFLIQKTENGDNLLVSIIRKNIIAEQIKLFKDAGQWPVAVSIGNFHIKNIISFIETFKHLILL